VGKGSRQRELAQQRALRQAQRREEQRRRRRRAGLAGAGVGLTAVVVVVALLLAGVFDSKKAPVTAETPTPTATPTVPRTAAATPSSSAAATPAAFTGTCADTPQTSGQNPKMPGLPPTTPLRTTGTYTATMVTDVGTVTWSMDAAKVPCTADSFRYLASKGFFDGTPCHRLTADPTLKVLQCGDPTGTGTGGPGYTIPDEDLPTAAAGMTTALYPRGTIAMANTGAAHTGGSQFFLVYGDSQLPPSYTVVGTVTKGKPVLDAIAAAGITAVPPPGATPAPTASPATPVLDGKPTKPVTISTLTVTA